MIQTIISWIGTIAYLFVVNFIPCWIVCEIHRAYRKWKDKKK